MKTYGTLAVGAGGKPGATKPAPSAADPSSDAKTQKPPLNLLAKVSLPADEAARKRTRRSPRIWRPAPHPSIPDRKRTLPAPEMRSRPSGRRRFRRCAGRAAARQGIARTRCRGGARPMRASLGVPPEHAEADDHADVPGQGRQKARHDDGRMPMRGAAETRRRKSRRKASRKRRRWATTNPRRRHRRRRGGRPVRRPRKRLRRLRTHRRLPRRRPHRRRSGAAASPTGTGPTIHQNSFDPACAARNGARGQG